MFHFCHFGNGLLQIIDKALLVSLTTRIKGTSDFPRQFILQLNTKGELIGAEYIDPEIPEFQIGSELVKQQFS